MAKKKASRKAPVKKAQAKRRVNGNYKAGEGVGRAADKYYMEEVVELTMDLLAKRQFKSTIKTIVQEATGLKYNPAKFEALLTKARVRMSGHLKKAREDTKGCAIENYEAIIRDKPGSADALRAQERIDALLGHDAKFSAHDGVEELATKMRRAIEEARGSVPTEE